jgi:hypothetical protein
LNFTLRVDLDQFAKIQPSSPKTKFSLRSWKCKSGMWQIRVILSAE